MNRLLPARRIHALIGASRPHNKMMTLKCPSPRSSDLRDLTTTNRIPRLAVDSQDTLPTVSPDWIREVFAEAAKIAAITGSRNMRWTIMRKKNPNPMPKYRWHHQKRYYSPR